ncbi:MAG: thiamine pyrophosphate-dependent dehydrogenase E1 component subunit alpha [Planctomycetota bacterium]|jgi:pyruvate dehydrogenase E1 component alpha subunit/2-oxoisovalerate dehydrogenase E1 component alpha subunit|nr:thiamine pyrophosphate-dependent dehydrogenase E1 component subunit alpha [Planctomycetota bacterium]
MANERLQYLDPSGRARSGLPDLKPERLRELFIHMLRVRCVERRMLDLQRAGRIGFVGTAKGLEAAIIGSAAALDKNDWLWSGLREGGAALMRGLPLSEYLAQMYGNGNDTAKGRQMSNHFQHAPSHYPSWSSVIGTQIPNAVGAAYAAKLRGSSEVHAVYFGDGASSSNGFHSGLNMAGTWQVPVVFVLVDNGWAISLSSRDQTAAESYGDKGAAYGIPAQEVDGNDVVACHVAMGEALERARSGSGPSLLVLSTYRVSGHSSSDDPARYRDPAEVAAWERRDPLERMERYLLGAGLLQEGDAATLEQGLLDEIDSAIHEQEAAAPVRLKTLVEDVYSEVPRHLREQYNRFLEVAQRHGKAQPGDGAFPL